MRLKSHVTVSATAANTHDYNTKSTRVTLPSLVFDHQLPSLLIFFLCHAAWRELLSR